MNDRNALVGALTAAIAALGSQQGEQQRPVQMFHGVATEAARIPNS